MFVTVQAFDDLKREFYDKRIQISNINAIDVEPIEQYGPHGVHTCVMVHMVNYWFWMAQESLPLIEK